MIEQDLKDKLVAVAKDPAHRQKFNDAITAGVKQGQEDYTALGIKAPAENNHEELVAFSEQGSLEMGRAVGRVYGFVKSLLSSEVNHPLVGALAAEQISRGVQSLAMKELKPLVEAEKLMAGGAGPIGNA